MRRLALLLVIPGLALSACGGEEGADLGDRDASENEAGSTRQAPPADSSTRKHDKAAPRGSAAVVARVVDGDTIDLTNGKTVRLVQIDTPELRGSECYAGRAKQALAALAPAGSRVRLEADPLLDRTDRYGRLLRYIYRGSLNVNTSLVRRGAATVWFYGGDRGRYAARLLTAARKARSANSGLWGSCPGTPFDPGSGADTGGGATSGGGRSGPDKDCSDFSSRAEAQRFFEAHGGPQRDPYRLDGDHDGKACESL